MTGGFAWDWGFAWSIMPTLLRGLELTIAATAIGATIATILGSIICLLRLASLPILSRSLTWLIQLIRSTPFLIQLYFLFYIVPKWGVSGSAFATGVGGIGIYYAAYASEIFRAGLEGLPSGQWEAALTLGLPLHRVWLGIALPQATVAVLPVLGNMVVAMFKETALLSTITIMELLAEARSIGSLEFRYIEPLTLAGMLYFAISYTSAKAIRGLEARHASRF